jgi:lipopolysaccharide transport system permease protein
MLIREVFQPHSGQVFGKFWIIFQPLLIVCIYLFIFSFVFNGRSSDSVGPSLDYTLYILCGVIPITSFNHSITKSCLSLTGNTNLIKQISSFPLELLPITYSLTSVFAFFIGIFFIIIYSFFFGHSTKIIFLLPFVILINILLNIGFGYFISILTVFIKDIREFVYMFVTFNLFITPTMYLPGQVPEILYRVVSWNPLSHIVWVYQDIFYFGYFFHKDSWIIFLFFCFFVFYSGYLFFNKMKLYISSFL